MDGRSWAEAVENHALGALMIPTDLQTSSKKKKKKSLRPVINLSWNIIWMPFHPVKEIGKWVHASWWFELWLQSCIACTHCEAVLLVRKVVDYEGQCEGSILGAHWRGCCSRTLEPWKTMRMLSQEWLCWICTPLLFNFVLRFILSLHMSEDFFLAPC